MGRDNHKGASNNSRNLPQTPKNQKINPGDMREEMAQEFTTLTNQQPKNKRKNNKNNRKNK